MFLTTPFFSLDKSIRLKKRKEIEGNEEKKNNFICHITNHVHTHSNRQSYPFFFTKI